ncbi:MAG: A24 family peptidase [Anaerolineales bacterium]
MILLWVTVGLAAGFLVNYLADVLPATRTLSRPEWWPPTLRSLRRFLGTPRVALIFLALGVAGGLLWQFPPQDFPVVWLAVVLAYFTLVTVVDIEHRVVMHPVSIAGGLLLGAIGLARHGLTDTLLGGAAGFVFMLALYFAGDWMGRVLAKMRKEKWADTALGFGDVNLAGVIGLLMGWPGVIVALFLGMLLAALYSGGLILLSVARGRYSAFSTIPYAPFLCLGAVLLVLAGVYNLLGR